MRRLAPFAHFDNDLKWFAAAPRNPNRALSWANRLDHLRYPRFHSRGWIGVAKSDAVRHHGTCRQRGPGPHLQSWASQRVAASEAAMSFVNACDCAPRPVLTRRASVRGRPGPF